LDDQPFLGGDFFVIRLQNQRLTVMAVQSTQQTPPDPSTWVDEYALPMFRYAMSQVGDHAAAEDLVQEAFLAALKNYESFSARSTFLTWLLSILRRKVVDYRRSSRKQVPLTRDAHSILDECFDNRNRWRKTLEKWPANPGDDLDKEEFWTVFQNCVEQLPPLLAEVFRLREILSCEIDEVCEVLDVTRGNLSVRLHRARMSLRGCLEDRWFNE